MKLTINIGYASDKGMKTDNEDFFGSLVPKEPQLTYKGIVAAIADGMSGNNDAGKQASHCCVVGFLTDYYSTPDSWSVKQAGQKIIAATNSWLYSHGNKRMVSTLSILILKSTTANIFHIGDSRIYRLRQGCLEQLTRDHRIWQSKDKSYVNRAMGIEPRLEADYQTFALEKGDVFLMTTNGVHEFVSEKILKACLLDGDNLNQQAANILRQAIDSHSDDNLTCQLIRIEELPEAKEDEIILQHLNLPFPPPLEIGAMVDGYRIEEKLPAHKRTQIYQAFDTIKYTPVVLKTPSVSQQEDSHYVEHFLLEEWVGKRINHKNVLKVLGDGRKKSCLYYVTEFIDGRTLRQWMQNNPKPNINTVRNIIEQIAKGLQAFHRLEMLHQDLTPENIMFDVYGTVRIIDFGSVKIVGISEITPLADAVPSAHNYTAPEYYLGQTGTIKSDLFSLGVIAYELLNGALPFGQNMPEKPDAASLQKLSYQPSVYNNEMIPIWMDGALRKATAINPRHRYDTLSEFLYDLHTPNSMFLKSEQFVPLAQRDPLIFWQSISALLLLVNLVLLYQLV
jgi:serine/threonine protein phosphatase PrpC